MFEQYVEQIEAEANKEFPKEAVWLITKKGCKRVKNVHEQPESYFRISEAETKKAMAAGLLAVVHTHPNGEAIPSSSDMAGQISTRVPWGILTCDGVGTSAIVWWGDGVEKPPLIGRTFRHGVTDCYALIKDYYDLELGIKLPDFPRDWAWWNEDQNLFEQGFTKAGFKQIDASDAQPGDVWLAKIGNVEVANHGGVLLENDLMIHQTGSNDAVDDSRPSAREPIYRYLRHITHWLRYVGDQK